MKWIELTVLDDYDNSKYFKITIAADSIVIMSDATFQQLVTPDLYNEDANYIKPSLKTYSKYQDAIYKSVPATNITLSNRRFYVTVHSIDEIKEMVKNA